MGNVEAEKLLKDIEELKAGMDAKTGKRLEFELLERILKRLDSFSSECEECRKSLKELEGHIDRLKAKKGSLWKSEINEHHTKMNNIIAHLQSKHKLVREGSYMSIFMCCGMSIGMVIGYVIFKNISIGMSIGMCIGMALGVCLDADEKKKGKTI